MNLCIRTQSSLCGWKMCSCLPSLFQLQLVLSLFCIYGLIRWTLHLCPCIISCLHLWCSCIMYGTCAENQEATLAKRKFPYVDKWLSNEQINQKLSNHFWKNENTLDTQITQILKFRFAQYMGNHRKNIFWPLNYPNPNCTLCRSNDRDTWPHLLYFDKCW